MFIILFMSILTNASQYTYCYNTSTLKKADLDLKITVDSSTEEDAMAKAAKLCFKILTKDKYPGEESGLDIIDVCVNGTLCRTR